MKVLTITALLLCILTTNCIASEPDPAFKVGTVQDALSGEARALMEEQSPVQPVDFFDHLKQMVLQTIREQKSHIGESVQIGLRALVIIGLCQVMTLSDNPYSRSISAMTGALGIMVCCGPTMMRSLQLTGQAMDEMTSFSKVLMPIVTTTAISSGSAASAASTYTLTILFSHLLFQFSEAIAFPVLFGCMACALVDTALGQKRLLRLRQFSTMLIDKTLRLFVYVFTGLLTITGVIAGNQDAAALKAIKFSISFSVPVVGGIISDAAETVLSGASFLKNTVGTFGMLAVLAISLVPFFRLALDYLLMKGVSALGGVMESSVTTLLEMLSTCIGYYMAVIGCCVYLNILSCVSLIRMVQI